MEGSRSASTVLDRAAVRAWMEEPDVKKREWRSRRPQRWKSAFLVMHMLAVEGENGPGYCGVWMLAQDDNGSVEQLERGIVYHDQIPARDVAVLDQLTRRLGCIVEPVGDAKRGFLRRFKRVVYRSRIPLVGWSLPTHLARLAIDWRVGKGPTFQDQFVFILGTTEPNKRARNPKGKQRRLRNGRVEDGHYPTIGIKVLDGPRTYIAFCGRGEADERDRIPEGGEGRPVPGWQFKGHFVDLVNNVAATTSRPVSLDEACTVFGVRAPPEHPGPSATLEQRIAFAFPSVATVGALYLAVLADHREHTSIWIPPDRIFSASAYSGAAGGYLDAVGVVPPLCKWDVPRHVLGYAMDALYAARTELRVRPIPSVPIPVVPTDHTGLYAAEAIRVGLWDMLIAQRFVWWEEDPATITAMLPSLLDEARGGGSPDLRFITLVRTAGDVLPRRLEEGKIMSLSVGPVWFPDPHWWYGADLLVSLLETGQLPDIVRVIHFATEGRQKGLRAVDLPGIGRFDPNVDGADLFRFIAEGRIRLKHLGERRGALHEQRLAGQYKGMLNSAVSGNLMRFDESNRRARGWKVRVWSAAALDENDYFEPQPRPSRIDVPGPWCFPPFAGLITANARLQLSLDFQAIKEAGGFVTYGDADSCVPLATAAETVHDWDFGALQTTVTTL